MIDNKRSFICLLSTHLKENKMAIFPRDQMHNQSKKSTMLLNEQHEKKSIQNVAYILKQQQTPRKWNLLKLPLVITTTRD